jgi:hypothetical protein
MSYKISSKKELSQIESDYDAFIAGSDQIWNPENSAINPMDCDRAYLLDFVHSKPKYAYAASVGKRSVEPPALLREFAMLWESFDGITMREHAGADYIGNCIGRDIETVVDPVLLHTADYWRKVAGSTTGKLDVVLVYNIRGFSELTEKAKELSANENLKCVDLLVPGLLQRGGKVSAGPAEFLSFLDSAKYVVTDSFHASAFSVIYGKKLYLMRNPQADNANSRMDTLFSWAGLSGIDDKCGKLSFVDCFQKDAARLDAEIARSTDVLSRMLTGECSCK